MSDAKQATDIDIYVGNRLRELRRGQGWTQEYVAEKIGLTFQQVQKYEKGTNRVTCGRAFSFAELFGVEISELFPESKRKRDLVPTVDRRDTLKALRLVQQTEQTLLSALAEVSR